MPLQTVEPLAGYPRGLAQTIVKARHLVEAGIKQPALIDLARDVVQMARPMDRFAYVHRVYAWTKTHFHYYPDPQTTFLAVEHLTRPDLLAVQFREKGMIRGDCDDLALIQAGMLGVLATPARFVTIATPASVTPRTPKGAYNHILTEGFTGAKWVSMDFLTSYPNPKSSVLPPLAWSV